MVTRSKTSKRLAALREAITALPTVASDNMTRLVGKVEKTHVAPDGDRWARIKGRRLGFDPSHHIRYEAVTHGNQAMLVSHHPAAAFTRFGTRKMVSRAKVPKGDGLGWWLPVLLRAFRVRLNRGSR